MQREGQATPRLPPKPADAVAEDDEPWLFRFDRSLTTAEAWKMGFSHVILLAAQGWKDEAIAAAELCEGESRPHAAPLHVLGKGPVWRSVPDGAPLAQRSAARAA